MWEYYFIYFECIRLLWSARRVSENVFGILVLKFEHNNY